MFKCLPLLLVLVACAPAVPKFPVSIKNQYTLDYRNGVVSCLKFEITSLKPYHIEYIGQAPLDECNGLTGYNPDDMVKLLNWIEDVGTWAEDHKKCFKSTN